MANTTIQLKNSGITSNVPAALAFGEIALNYADGKLFYKAANNAIVPLGSQSNAFGTVNANGTLVVADSPSAILSIVAGNNVTIDGDVINDKITINAPVDYIYNAANAAQYTANLAFDKANAANVLAYNTGIGANAYAKTIGASSNAWTNTVFGYANASFVKLSNGTQTITGNISVTGNVSTNTLVITESTDSITYTRNIDGWFYDRSFSVAAQEDEPRDIDFKSDGTKMYILGNAGNDITVYELSSAWNVETAAANITFSVAPQETAATGLYFKPDGTKFYIVGQSTDNVYQYNVTSAWDLATASYESKFFSVSSQETTSHAVSFSSDGTKMYILGDTKDTVYQYTVATPWDVSTASYASKSLSVATYDTIPQGLTFNSDGTKMYVVGTLYTRIVEYTLGTAWDISTASFTNLTVASNLGIYDLTGISGLYINPTLSYVYITDYSNDRVFQLKANVPSTKLVGTKWIVEPDLLAKNDLVVDKNGRFNGQLRVVGAAYVTGGFLTTGTLSATATITFSATTQAISIGTSQTTGNTIIGGTSQSGAITIGRSTVTQTTEIANSALLAANTKTVRIGTGGLANSITNIIIGSSVSGATSNVDIYGKTSITGNVGIGTTSPTSNLHVIGTANITTSLTVAGADVASYETGTFTTTCRIADLTTGGNVSVTLPSIAAYTKIGNMCTVFIAFTNIQTQGLVAGNQMYVRGLPFTSYNGNFQTAPVSVTSLTYGTDIPVFQITGNSTYGRVLRERSGEAFVASSISDYANNTSDLYLTASYITA